jgi:type II secretory pathway pseudopilin PulG
MPLHARNQRRAFTVLEGILALALVTTAMLTLLTVFALASSHARLSRDAVLARTVATSVQDEIFAHGLGRQKLPPDWSVGPGGDWTRSYEFPQTVEGRAAAPVHYDVSLTKSLNGNGAFFRTSGEVPPSDVVQVSIKWHESGHDHDETLTYDVTVLNR